MNTNIHSYNASLSEPFQALCERLMKIIDTNLHFTESKIWHSHPVWFIDGNPIVGYSTTKAGIRLMFWSGADFGESTLEPGTGKFKDASCLYTSVDQVNEAEIKNWLKKSELIQWDYKNIVKRKGKLERLL